MKNRRSRSESDRETIVDRVLTHYRLDTEGFRARMPDVAEALDSMFPPHRLSRTPFGLTENERAHRELTLRNLLSDLRRGDISTGDATRTLEQCAVLAEDDSLGLEVDRRTLLQLLRLFLGKPVGSITTATTISATDDTNVKAARHISLLRGIVLDLTTDMRLVSITINPSRIKGRQRIMRFVAMLKPSSNSSTQRDNSDSETDNHATS